MAIIKRYSFRVRGFGAFPLDMLRYDACWPSTQHDVFQMDSDEREPREVRLESFQSPTEGRWASFGWKVMEVGMRRA